MNEQRLSGVERVGMMLRELEGAGFRGEVRTVYGARGIKHVHVQLYLDLEQGEGKWREKLVRLGDGFRRMGR